MQRYRLGFAVALLVLALDQFAKWLVTHPLGVERNGDQMVFGRFFNLTYVQNEGISLGLLNAKTDVGRWMLVGLTSAIAVGVAIWICRETDRLKQAALGMILGGALGNILDRTLHGFVVDFLDLHFGNFRPFLVFNVGDAAITVGVAILLLAEFLPRKDHREGPDPKETIEHA